MFAERYEKKKKKKTLKNTIRRTADHGQETESEVVWVLSRSSGLANTIYRALVMQKIKEEEKLDGKTELKEWTLINFSSTTVAAKTAQG